MPTQIKKNETVVAPFFKNGVTLQFFQIDFGADVSALLSATTAGARSPVAVALEAIQQVCSIEVIGTVDNTGGTGQGLRIGVAALGGNFGTDTYDGTNSETFAAHLEDLVQATSTATSGWVTYQGVNLDGATVAAYTL